MSVPGTKGQMYKGRATLDTMHEMRYYEMGVRGTLIPGVTYRSCDL